MVSLRLWVGDFTTTAIWINLTYVEGVSIGVIGPHQSTLSIDQIKEAVKVRSLFVKRSLGFKCPHG